MKDIVHFEPITSNTFSSYIEAGTHAYNQHYKHLWPNGNSSPYIESSFTQEVLKKEETDQNTVLYRIIRNSEVVGILKITLSAALDIYSKKEALYLDKVYILNEHSGKGIGKKVLQFVMLRAKEMQKKIVWLDTMQKGPALYFYLKNGFKIYGESKVMFPSVIKDESLMWVMVKQVE